MRFQWDGEDYTWRAFIDLITTQDSDVANCKVAVETTYQRNKSQVQFQNQFAAFGSERAHYPMFWKEFLTIFSGFGAEVWIHDCYGTNKPCVLKLKTIEEFYL